MYNLNSLSTHYTLRFMFIHNMFLSATEKNIFQKNYLWEKIIPTVTNKDVYTYLRYVHDIKDLFWPYYYNNILATKKTILVLYRQNHLYSLIFRLRFIKPQNEESIYKKEANVEWSFKNGPYVLWCLSTKFWSLLLRKLISFQLLFWVNLSHSRELTWYDIDMEGH